jgi:hypothetical protein
MHFFMFRCPISAIEWTAAISRQLTSILEHRSVVDPPGNRFDNGDANRTVALSLYHSSERVH